MLFLNPVKTIFPQIDFNAHPCTSYVDMYMYIIEYLKKALKNGLTNECYAQVMQLKDWAEMSPNTDVEEEDVFTLFLVVFFERLFEDSKLRVLIPFLVSKAYLKENKELILQGVSSKDFKRALSLFKAGE